MAENDATQPDAQEHEVEQGFKDESAESQEEFQEASEDIELSPRERAIEELVLKRNEEFESEAGEEPVERVAEGVVEDEEDPAAPIGTE